MSRYNPLNENDARSFAATVVQAAQSLAQRHVPFLEGVRQLSSLRFQAGGEGHDPDFLLFLAIDSQSDHIPNVDTHAMCSEVWLRECDTEAQELERTYGAEVNAACAKLVARFSAEA
ncbi:MAG: hypothetical protein Q8L92_17285 [Rubrivivax sp.]|nr:hypothetical protein [Rubrivivax sp.]